ncbi:MAG TPA: DoxX family protein [Chitinophagaceae bacterium]|nr:DoxX family protein [Chitinophagaceae bacterium]
MSLQHRLEHWSSAHHPAWLVVVRIALGIGLFIKGISFISDTARLQQLLASSHFTQPFPWLSYVITWLHLFGGFMIIVGLFTRTMAALQLPILLGAILFINSGNGVFAFPGELVLSLVVLFLLVLFVAEGGGPLSLDHFFKHHQA